MEFFIVWSSANEIARTRDGLDNYSISSNFNPPNSTALVFKAEKIEEASGILRR